MYNGKPTNATFYLTAIDLMRKKLGSGAIFVVVSDDMGWCRDHLSGSPDVVMAGEGDVSDPGHDLALLSVCNHTIFAYGTFGQTAAMHNPNGITITLNPKSIGYGGDNNMYSGLANDRPNWIMLN